MRLDPLLCGENDSTLAAVGVVCALVVNEPLLRGQRQRTRRARPVDLMFGEVAPRVPCAITQELALATVMRIVGFHLVLPPPLRAGKDTRAPLTLEPVRRALVDFQLEICVANVPALVAEPVRVYSLLMFPQGGWDDQFIEDVVTGPTAVSSDRSHPDSFRRAIGFLRRE